MVLGFSIKVTDNKISVIDNKIKEAGGTKNTNVLVAVHYDSGEWANLSSVYIWNAGGDVGPAFYSAEYPYPPFYIQPWTENNWYIFGDMPYGNTSGNIEGTYDYKPYGGGGYIIRTFATE